MLARWRRALLIAVPVGIAVGLVAALRQPRAPQVQLYDVGAEFNDVSKNTQYTDQSTTFYYSGRASVHLHAMGLAQLCPLHIHRRNDEVTVIVKGTARVRQVWGHPPGTETRTADYPPPSILLSPVGCGHEWLNPDPAHMLGNLVFAEPTFEGNFYLRDDDPLLLKGHEPLAINPEARLAELAARGESSRLEPLPAFDGRIALEVASVPLELPASDAGPTIVYVAEGEGTFAAQGEAKPYRPTELRVIPRGISARLTPAVGHPLASLIFTPDGADRPRVDAAR